MLHAARQLPAWLIFDVSQEMKTPKPGQPIDVPPGTVQIGGPIEWFSISVWLRGDALIPEEITAQLGRSPDSGWQKDKPVYRKDGTFMRIPRFGAWSAELKREDTDEWDCGEAILELFATLPSDPVVWRLAERFSISLSVGLSLESSGCGFELSPERCGIWAIEELRRVSKFTPIAAKQANKAPEPTPGSVTPRATEGVSK